MKRLIQSGTWVFGICLLYSSNLLATTLEFEPCQIRQQAVKMDAECATLVQAENPQDPEGRQVELFVARLAATSANPANDAFTVIQGGPGGSSIDLAISMHNVLELVRRKRDVLIVDQRGTGRSNELNCDSAEIEYEFDIEQLTKLTRACESKLSSFADLRYYTTSIAVQDLDAVRRAAGYPQLSIYGVSYGTRVAQHYLRRFPEHTRLLVIDGVVDVGLNLAGPEIALRSQAAFDNMAQRCQQDSACDKQFGNIKNKFNQVQKRLKQAPVTIASRHPRSGEQVEMKITESDLLTSVRLMPYYTETLSLLPLLIARAYEGDYGLLASQSQLTAESLEQSLSIGMHNSVACTEDEPFVDYQNKVSAASTYFGDQMQESLKASCTHWPRGILDDDFHQTFDSDKPVLVLSGETDPITPPSNGARAAQMFSNSLHITVPDHGHGVVSRGCMPYLLSDFLEFVDLTSLNTQCVNRERATPFFISGSGPQP